MTQVRGTRSYVYLASAPAAGQQPVRAARIPHF
jgi:hypothetical protein